GTLAIRTSTVSLSDVHGIDNDLKPGQFVQLALADTGSGMPPDVAARVFEPFFTTKSGGRGTGLGLSMVYGFAKQSGGTVTIDSTPGRGTTVSIFLPLSDADVEAPGDAPSPQAAPGVARTVLLVEDETEVRNIVRRQLE